MSSADNPSTERKVWETPTVIVGTARNDTYSNVNTLGVDGVNPTTGGSYGS